MLVRYNCLAIGTCSFNMTIQMDPPLAPYKDIHFAWKKECDGQAAGLDIFSYDPEVMNGGDIVDNGIVNATFSPEFGKDDHTQRLWLTADIETSIAITVDVADPKILSFSTSPSTLQITSTREAFAVLIDFGCLKNGETTAAISFAAGAADPITYTITKACAVWYDSQDGLLALSSFILLGIIVFGFVVNGLGKLFTDRYFLDFDEVTEVHEPLVEPSNLAYG